MTSGFPSGRLFDEAFLRRLERLALVYRRNSTSTLQGERKSAQRGQSVEFSDFRPYTLGDDFRRIDWNAYARLERLFVKLYVEQKDVRVDLLIDNSASMDWGVPNKLSYAVRAAAAIGYLTLVGLDRVAAQFLYAEKARNVSGFQPVRGKKSAINLFAFLQSIRPNQDPQAIPRLAGNLTGAVFVFSDLLGDEWRTFTQQLAGQAREVCIIHILAPDELEPSLAGEYKLVDCETDQQVEITADYESLRRYVNHLQNWQKEWMEFCRSRQISYVPVSSNLPLEELLFAALPRQGVLR